MFCPNNSFSSPIFVSDLPSYGLIGLISIGLILYIGYMIVYLRNPPSSSTSFYIPFSQLFLLLLLLTPITFLIRPSASINIICPLQTLSLQIFPFCLLLSYNVHMAYLWLRTSTENSRKKSCLIAISTTLICFLAILIQMSILLIWFYNRKSYQQLNEICSTECPRPLFLCSLSFNFFLLFLYSFQSSIRYHCSSDRHDFISLFISLLAIGVTIIWICFYLFVPLRSTWTFYMTNNSILAYGTIFFVYAFLGPLLFEQLFYPPANCRRRYRKDQIEKSNKVTFQSLSLTKEQQRAFMAAYIKRNLTASCENLTSITIASPLTTNRANHSETCHSTLSVESLCPTLASTVSRDQPNRTLPTTTTTTDTSSCGTMTSDCLLLSNSALKTNENK